MSIWSLQIKFWWKTLGRITSEIISQNTWWQWEAYSRLWSQSLEANAFSESELYFGVAIKRERRVKKQENQCGWHLWQSFLITNLTQSVIGWDGHLSEGSSRLGWPVGMCVEDYLSFVNWCGKTPPLWVAPSPSKRVSNSVQCRKWPDTS